MSQWDTFFYYGKGSIEDENQQDLLQLVSQPSSSMFYNRSYGCDVKYNFPMSAVNHALVAYSVANGIAKRNQVVSDGSDGTADRRVAVSQNTVSVVDGDRGERTLQILYFNYADTTIPQQSSIQVA